ncbi:cytoplasmic tRNA 2-thiolation protein 2-like [Syngnathus acus]|uniref:cytoplasmic tRNA 2-thiolation protein 2-like n=1 Tax=Syngnathus acus TaxID=161584 RepID=UPI001885E0F3|nr:cytoplasmic tRNA 2-thiolation protein 2-like [Syngnathus acus]XP_037126858.1 cytoplasmic tRNA 2-thiolation protein 2-like [Syngnathus acus]
MCQVAEAYNDDLEQKEVPSVSKKCVKCKEAIAVVAIRAGDRYCRDCFEQYFRHKFRAILGKNRVISPGEKVLLAVSGGPSSSSMLRQVQEALSPNAHKKLRFIPGIVYIDDGGVFNRSVEERRQTVAKLQDIFQATGFPFHVAPLEQVLELPSSVLAAAWSSSAQRASSYTACADNVIGDASDNCLTAEPPREPSSPYVDQTRLLQQLIDAPKTLTAKEDLLGVLRQHLLVHTARCEGYTKLMFGDNCTRLAVKLISSISLGRGAQLAQDTSFSDSRYGNVMSLKPMRDYSAKEIAYYNHIFRVPSVFTPNLHTKSGEKASIQRLTESFVNKLQVDFPSTVSTIYRTGEKLQTTCKSSSSADPGPRCLLCACSLDTTIENASAFQSTRISECLSQTKCVADAGWTRQGEPCRPSVEERGCCSVASHRVPDATDIRGLLCYSCRLTVKEMSSVDRLPQYILSEAQTRQRRSRMREEIRDFLLED